MRSEVARARMTESYRRVGVRIFLAQNGGHRFADDVTATENDHVSSVGFHSRTDQQLLNAGGRARRKSSWIAQHEFARVDGMKAIDVFCRRHGGVNNGTANVRRKGRLHQNAVQASVGVELVGVDLSWRGHASEWRRAIGFRLAESVNR